MKLILGMLSGYVFYEWRVNKNLYQVGGIHENYAQVNTGLPNFNTDTILLNFNGEK